MSAALALLLVAGGLSPEPSLEDALLARPHRYEMLVVARTDAPVVGGVEGGTRTLGISRFRRDDGGALVHELEVCDVELEGGTALFSTYVPSRFIAALRPKTGQVTVRGESVEIDMGQEYIGFRETHAAKWPPEHRRSDGVTDSDGDGRPGATLELRIVDVGRVNLLIAQRAHSVLSGRAQEGGVRGRVRLKQLEQRVLDTEPGLFKMNAPVTPLLEKSWFKLTPVNGEATCRTLFNKPSQRERTATLER
jgi:hypothetical protein